MGGKTINFYVKTKFTLPASAIVPTAQKGGGARLLDAMTER